MSWQLEKASGSAQVGMWRARRGNKVMAFFFYLSFSVLIHKLKICKTSYGAISGTRPLLLLLLAILPILQCFIHVSVHVKDLKIKKVKVQTNRSSAFPQNTLLMKRLVSRPAVTSQLRHHVRRLHHLCLADSFWLLKN